MYNILGILPAERTHLKKNGFSYITVFIIQCLLLIKHPQANNITFTKMLKDNT